jgi:hypothetical protein
LRHWCIPDAAQDYAPGCTIIPREWEVGRYSYGTRSGFPQATWNRAGMIQRSMFISSAETDFQYLEINRNAHRQFVAIHARCRHIIAAEITRIPASAGNSQRSGTTPTSAPPRAVPVMEPATITRGHMGKQRSDMQ